MLVHTLLAQALILTAAGAILFENLRGSALEQLDQYKGRHNDRTPGLIREQVSDLCASMFVDGDERLKPLLTQAHFEPEAAAWILDPDGNVMWALHDARPHGARGLHDAGPPAWEAQLGERRQVEIRRDSAEQGRVLSTRHLLPNGFGLVVVEPAPEVEMFDHATLVGTAIQTAGAGVATLGLTALVTLAIMQRYESQIERMNAELEAEIERQVDASTQRLHAMIFGLAKLADFRDSDTGAHLDRICEYAGVLARALAPEKPDINDAWIENLKLAASLHDIGKVGVPDGVLLKPGDLTQEERQVIEQHPLFGADTLIAVRRRLGDSPLLNLSIEIALQHHERWDGTGYPFGLAGEQISLSARIVAVADVYDALRSARVYKPSLSHGQAVEVIAQAGGSQFDPLITRAFLRVEHEFEAVADRWQRTASPSAQGARRAA